MIYADENVWQPVAEGLRRRGWDVTTTLDEGTLGYSDYEQIVRRVDTALERHEGHDLSDEIVCA